MNRIFAPAALLALALTLAGGLASAQALTVWTTFDGATLDYLREDVDAFTSSFGVDAEVVRLDITDLKRRMLNEAPEGGGGDVLVGVPHDQIAEMASEGVLANLGRHATADYLEDLSEQARLAFTYEGGLLGLPLFVEGPALLYNRDLVDEVPADYDAFVRKARELTTDGIHGFLFDVGNFYFNHAWLATHGGYVFGRVDGALRPDDVGLAEPGAVRGAEALRALRHDHELIPANTDHALAHERFVDGALAMFYTGPWAVAPAREAGIEVGIAPMPPLADGTPWSGFMGSQGVLVNEFGADRTDAVNLAKWLSRDDAQTGYARLEGRIPASASALERASNDPVVAGFGEALLTSRPIPNLPEMRDVWSPMDAAIGEILERPDSDAAAALRRAVGRITGE